MILAMSLLLAASSAAPLENHIVALNCGPADLRIVSRAYAGQNAPLAPASQTLTRRVGGRQVPVTLERGRGIVVDGYRVHDRYVVSWACVTSTHQAHYVLLGYGCAVDPGDPNDCGGEKEWFRLLDGRGRFVDVGVPHDGAASERLNARLGIAGALTAGVTMTPVVE